jgi:alpha-tubulin suppressor-like RCC1 family protein
LVPVQAITVPPSKSITAGAEHECVIDMSNTVWCWGSDASGELGNGQTPTSFDPPMPVPNLKASQVSGGDAFTCAVTLAATVKCWGNNFYGQLGDGNNTNANTPRLVSGLTNVTQVAAGDSHACALLKTAQVECWGDNRDGELGIGTTTPAMSNVPRPTEATGVKTIAAGLADTCAISLTTALECWGDNQDGELGDGTTTSRSLPTPVAGLDSGVRQVTMGWVHTCALLTSVTVCWGDPSAGKVGNGQYRPVPPTPLPTPVFGLVSLASSGGGVVQVAAGRYHSCVVLSTGHVKCWGNGAWGALGDGSVSPQAIPTLTVGLPSAGTAIVGISESQDGGCALNSQLALKCWGLLTGNGDTGEHDSAVASLQGQVAQASEGYGGCALTPKDQVTCWGSNFLGQLGVGTHGNFTGTPSLVPGLTSIQQVSDSELHVCALAKDGSVDCWGNNSNGQLGDGSTTERDSPVPVTGLPGVAVQISAGGDSTCALMRSTTVWCWGGGGAGELGNNSTSDSSAPVQVKGLTGAVQIDVGGATACAVLQTGIAKCWGDDTSGELGDGFTTNQKTPVTVNGLSGGVVQIINTGEDGCALLQSSGEVQCWGADDVGQIGNGTTSATPSLTPVTVSGLSGGALALGTNPGGNSECLITIANQAECWGSGFDGRLGNGGTADEHTPQPVAGL